MHVATAAVARTEKRKKQPMIVARFHRHGQDCKPPTAPYNQWYTCTLLQMIPSSDSLQHEMHTIVDMST
jgi:hypothetical protein